MIKHLLDFTGGHNDVVEPDYIGENQVTDSQNYEVLGQGGLTLRKEAEVYDSTLNTYISATLAIVTLKSISPPLYPSVKPTNMVGDFMLLVYGATAASYEMYLVYEIAGGNWTYLASAVNMLQGLTDAGVDWTAACDPEYSIGNNRIVITDGVNRAYSVEVNNDGDVTSGVMGVPAPTVRATAGAAQTEKLSENPNFTSSEGGSVGLPGLVQIAYTIVTKDGNESNPSPVSATIDMQWLRKDDDLVDNRWIGSIPITNLWLPTSLTTQEREDIKYFNVYVRAVRYSGGQYSSTLQFTQQFIISDKNGANTYRVSLPIEEGNLVSYEKDIAPIATHNAQVGGITFIAGITDQLVFGIGDFDYFVPITITNNGEDYVDAIVRMRLYDTDSGTTPISNLDWSDDLAVTMNTSPDIFSPAARAQNYALIDQDLKTPLVTYYEGFAAGNYVDVWTKIPYLPSGSRTIYFAWKPSAGSPRTITATATTGLWLDSTLLGGLGSGWEAAQDNLWADYTRLPNQKTIVASAINDSGVIPGGIGRQGNRANSNNPGLPPDNLIRDGRGYDVINNGNISFVSQVFHNSSLTTPNFREVGTNPYIELNSASLTGYRNLRYASNGLGAVPRSGTVWFRMGALGIDTGADECIFSFSRVGDARPLLMLMLEATATVKTWQLYISDGTNLTGLANYGLRAEDDRGVYPKASGKGYFVACSWDGASSLTSLMLIDVNHFNPANNVQQVDYAETALPALPDVDFTEGFIAFGDSGTTNNFPGCLDATGGGANPASYAEIVVMQDVYYSASTQVEMDALINVSNFMPAFPEPVGYANIALTHNQNISFGTVVQSDLKTFRNKFRWSEPNGVNFPDLYAKFVAEPIDALLPSPSFLKTEYGNTLVIFTRNLTHRFLMDDADVSTWATDTNRLIQERQGYGLYAKDTLAVAGDRIIYLGEDGLILWDSQGLQKISQNVIKITLRAIASMVGWIQPLRDQYMLHDRTDDTTYVYHFKYGTFYKFSGMQIDNGIPRVLSGGTLAENINLMPWGTNDIYAYPGSTDTTSTAYIITKHYNHLRGVFKRLRFYFTGGNVTIAPHIIDNTLDPTELMPTAADRTCAAGSAWTNPAAPNGIDTYALNGTLALQVNAISQYCYIPVASMPMTVGTEYTLQFDCSSLSSFWILKDFTGAEEFGRVTANGTSQLVTFTPTVGGGLRIVGGSANSEGIFDNFSLKTRDRNESKSPTSGVWNWITNGKNLGEKIFFKITGAKTILSGMYDYLIRGAR